jgi:hypothetical protein
MANGRPGDSRLHDIVHLGINVYGPSCDALIREIEARVPRSHRHEFRDMIETWPWEADGSGPRDTDALFQRLLDWRERVDRLQPAPPEAPVAAPQPVLPGAAPPRSAGGRAARAVLGFILGAVGGAVTAFVVAMLVVTIPTGDAAMGTAIGIFLVSILAGLAGGVLGAVLLAR